MIMELTIGRVVYIGTYTCFGDIPSERDGMASALSYSHQNAIMALDVVHLIVRNNWVGFRM